MVEKNVQKQILQITEKVEGMGKEIEKLIPYAIIKKTTVFGNSSHVVLSRNFLDKKVGIIILGENDE